MSSVNSACTRRRAGTTTPYLRSSVLVHGARFYQWLGAGGDVENTRSIAGFILARPRARLAARELMSSVHCCRTMRLDQLHEAVSPLVAMDWLIPEEGHRPRAWRVNQHVYVQFAEQAELEKARRAETRKLIISSAATRRQSEHEVI